MLFDFYDHIKNKTDLPIHFMEFVKDLPLNDSKLYYTLENLKIDEDIDREELTDMVDELLDDLSDTLTNIDGINLAITMRPIAKNNATDSYDKTPYVSVIFMTLTFDFIDRFKEKIGSLHIDDEVREIIGKTFKDLCTKCHIMTNDNHDDGDLVFNIIQNVIEDSLKTDQLADTADLDRAISGELENNVINESIRKCAETHSNTLTNVLLDMYLELYDIYKKHIEYEEWCKGVNEHVGNDKNMLIMKTPASTYYFLINGISLKS